jgi:hypothetical protein
MRRFFNTKGERTKKDTLRRMQPVLQALLDGLNKVKTAPNNLEAAVYLFQAIAPYPDQIFDAEYKIFKDIGYETEQLAIAKLQATIFSVRHNNHHYLSCLDNRQVTADTVFFGAKDLDIPLLSITEWLQHAVDSKKILRPDLSKNPSQPKNEWHIVHDLFCGEFIDNYLDTFFQNIAQLKLV